MAGRTAQPEPHQALKRLTWEQFCSGRSLQRYCPGLSENWRSCSAPWRCGAGSSLPSCKEEQKQDAVSRWCYTTFRKVCLLLMVPFRKSLLGFWVLCHLLCTHADTTCVTTPSLPHAPAHHMPQVDINTWQQFNSSWPLSPWAPRAPTLQHSLWPDAVVFQNLNY